MGVYHGGHRRGRVYHGGEAGAGQGPIEVDADVIQDQYRYVIMHGTCGKTCLTRTRTHAEDRVHHVCSISMPSLWHRNGLVRRCAGHDRGVA